MASIRRTRRPLRLIAVILAVSLLPLVASSNAEAASPKRVSAVEAPPLQSTTFRSKTPEKRVPDKAFVPSARGFKEGVSRQVASSDSGKVFRNADGTTTAFIKPESFNGPRADRQKMTPLKREANGSFGVTRGDKKLDLNAKSSASHVKLSDKTSSLSFGLAGAQIRDGQQVGESVEYLDVAPGIDLVYSMTPSGLKEIIRVKSPQGIRDSYRFDLNTSGLKASVDSHANIVFVSDSGTKVAMIPPGVATDSGPDAFRSPSPVGVRLADNNTAIEVVPDAKWMRDSARTFPLLVDPTVIFGAVHQPAVDTTISNLNTTTNYDALQNASGEYITNVGHCPGMGETYGYMRWDLSLLAGHNVTSAELQANVLSVQNPNPANSIKMWRTIQPWDSTTFTWAQMTQGYGNHGTDKIVLGAPAVGAHGWDVTPWVQNWNNGTWANHGVSMDTGNLNTCYSLGAQGTGSTNYAPILVVNASNSAPTNVSITTPADNGSSVSAWPTFSATATDAESDPIKYQYQVSGDDTFTSLLVDSPNAGPTWTSNVQLDNGRTYWLRVIAKDDPFGAQSISPVTRFTVNFGGGSQPIAANDNVGPVAVSMTSGNVSTSVSSPVANTLRRWSRPHVDL